jgi:hypothetical protein
MINVKQVCCEEGCSLLPSYNILARNKIPQVKNTQKPRYDRCEKRLVLRKAVASNTNIGGKPKFVLTTEL